MFPVTTSIPSLALFGTSLLKPALLSIVLKGDNIASERTLLPILILFSFNDALTKAIPPPGTIPSLIAALVAQIASSTLSLFSFNSISELAPTFTTAILAASIASLFSNLITS